MGRLRIRGRILADLTYLRNCYIFGLKIARAPKSSLCYEIKFGNALRN